MKRTITLLFLLSFGASLFSQTQYSKVRIDLQQVELSNLALLGIDINEGVLKKGAYFETDLSEDEIKKLAVNGIPSEIIIKDVADYYFQRAFAEKNLKITRDTEEEWNVPENWEYGSMGGFYTLNQVYAELDSMYVKYPNIITQHQPISIDTLTHDGRMQYWIKISDNPGTDEDEPEVLYTGVHHAREPMSVQQTIFFMWYLLENYDSDEEIQRIVDNTELYFVPVINPDGYAHNESTNPNGGGMWRKNRRDNGDGSHGVDPNRNYGYFWGLDDEGSSPWPSDETYRGPGPFSEPEIKNIRDFCNDHEFLIALNYHSYSNLLLSPWGYTVELPPDNDILIAYAELMTKENNYTYGPGSTTIYPTNGGSDDWMYGEDNTKDPIFSYTPEVGSGNDGFWPSVSRIIPLCQDQMWQNLTAAKLVGNYGVVDDISPAVTNEIENYAVFNLTRLGLSNTETFIVSISVLDEHILDVGDPISFNDMELLTTLTDSISYVLDAGIENGSIFKYLISLDNGEFVVSDTVTKVYGTEILVFMDDCETTDNWISQKWDNTDEDFYSPSFSITDSPNSDYAHNENSSITLDTTISLANTSVAFLRFWAKWDIEEAYDYVQISAKEEGSSTWVPLHGNYSSYGNNYLNPGDPVYDGIQNEWVLEEINLMDFADKDITLRFRFYSDSYVNGDGFYFDDLSVSVISTITDIEQLKDVKNNIFISDAYPNPTHDIFNVQYRLTDNDHAVFELYNAFGNQLRSLEISNKKGTIKMQLNDLPKGIYYFRIVNGNQISNTLKFIKL